MYYQYISRTDSTNRLLKDLVRAQALPEGFVVRTDYQEKGRGQAGNHWESERGKNLLISVLLRPEHVELAEQFILSQLVSLAILRTLQAMVSPTQAAGFSIKWPNDIYWQDRKIGGILIENVLLGTRMSSSVLGIGLNINQTRFLSDAPNPVSLRQITGTSHSKMNILHRLMNELLPLYHEASFEQVRTLYRSHLYRRSGYHRFYSEAKGYFEATIERIENDGCLVVREQSGQETGFYFKEVVFA
ncbi:MAG: biotin--[acetyl-CoA-carboxylase] ligase [Paludibacter sp.]|nr:biotin--[acetyl-CoA-carboxylase] ligase [Paludibacter sp.]